ncbi:MAG: ribosomal protein S18-alanine N-acetyltransferase [Hyphomicrobiaceae bacterium]
MSTPPPDLEIGRAGAPSAGAFAELHRMCFADPWSREAFERLLALPATIALAARQGADTVGLVLSQCVTDQAEIVTLAVSPEQMRHGIASALVRRLLDELAAQDVETLFLEVAANNTAARALYRSLGFAEVGQRRGYYVREGAPAVDAIMMARPACRLPRASAD